jgi:uncharacterized protein YndB with AHSA1/START domain
VHGSFTIERSYRAAPARVFAAWTDIETKARWFMGPPERWKLLNRELDLRAGGSEILHGQLTNGTTTLFTARYHAVVPDERLVYAYDMHIGEKHLSVSLATVELAAAKGGGTRMTFTEQAAFLDGEDGTRSREAGTAAHFERLGPVLDDPAEIFASRVMDAPRDRVFQAFGDPDTLSRWWGPKGFRSTFQEHSLRPGGAADARARRRRIRDEERRRRRGPARPHRPAARAAEPLVHDGDRLDGSGPEDVAHMAYAIRLRGAGRRRARARHGGQRAELRPPRRTPGRDRRGVIGERRDL